MIPMNFLKNEIYEWIPRLFSIVVLLAVGLFFFFNLIENVETNHVI